MSWAAGRRMLILAIIGGVVLLVLGTATFLSFHKAPSCTDGKQNQNEEGIDCGGTCSYICTAGVVPPVVSFVRDLRGASGRTDVVAYIKNPNASAAAKGVRYTVELYSADHTVLAKKEGVTDLAPGTETVVFIPNMFSGEQSIDRAFLILDDAPYQWFRYEAQPLVPIVKNAQMSGSADAPRVTATIENPFVTALRGIKLTATVFNAAGNAIAASQTIVPELGPQNSTDIVFTWNAPFSDVDARIDVRPFIPLPSP